MSQTRPPRVERRRTRTVRVGDVTIGGDAPVSVQSMATTPTGDPGATLAQIGELAAAGCEIIRCAVPTRGAIEGLSRIASESPIPVIADIHFDYRLALASLDAGAHGVRVNPGNMRDRQGLREVYHLARETGAKVRIGVNSGSIRPREGLEVKPDAGGELAELMVAEALDYCREAEDQSLENIVLSLKASDVPTTIAAYRLAAERCDYPFHVGVTAAGPPDVSLVKSAIGIGTLLAEGIGDTIRVSMTGPPQEEVRAGRAILEALELREPLGAEIISCPTCARCEIDLASLVEEVRERLKGAPAGLKVAVMGCVVNGPGEAAESDVGVAGGRDFGYVFVKGRKVRKAPASELADALVAEIEKLSASETETSQ